MVRLDGGRFLMGTEDRNGFPLDGEGPVREVSLNAFLIDETAVTNEQFAEFISNTGYVTDAERFGWSFCFHHFVSDEVAASVEQRVAGADWWWRVDGADWRHPDGHDSGIEQRMDHPVTQVSFSDASAFARWCGKRLPTEAEWEYAARGGLEQNRYAWGNSLTPGGEHRCNIWQGEFPKFNTLEDGYHGTAPARSFEPNAFGLFNTSGNVWEWCADWWGIDWSAVETENPTGPETGQARVTRGGSFLCHSSYCNRYRVAARTSNTPDSATANMGFRCVLSGD
jgi:formylglycine-generating enzyme